MTLFSPRTRYAAIVLLVALLASLAVAFFRVRTEAHANRVELAMDFTDFDALARSYDYNPAAFLIALRRAGLTSLALTEELGANVGLDGKAYVTTGAALVNQARVSPIGDPLLADLVRTRRVVERRGLSARFGPVHVPSLPARAGAALYAAQRARLASHEAVAARSTHTNRLL